MPYIQLHSFYDRCVHLKNILCKYITTYLLRTVVIMQIALKLQKFILNLIQSICPSYFSVEIGNLMHASFFNSKVENKYPETSAVCLTLERPN